MDLTQLANLGEFIGGAAVLVTLVYPGPFRGPSDVRYGTREPRSGRTRCSRRGFEAPDIQRNRR